MKGRCIYEGENKTGIFEDIENKMLFKTKEIPGISHRKSKQIPGIFERKVTT